MTIEQLTEVLREFRYMSKRGLGMRGLANHHITALADYLYPIIPNVYSCTGMLDCRGMKICEGDIVRGIETWQPWDHIGVVAYSSEYGAYYLTIPGKPDKDYLIPLHEYDLLHKLGTVRNNPDIQLSMLYYGDEGYPEDGECMREELKKVVAELTGAVE